MTRLLLVILGVFVGCCALYYAHWVLVRRRLVTIVRDRIRDLIRKGLTLEQVKAARPTLDYDGRYGSADAFIETAFRDLTSAR